MSFEIKFYSVQLGRMVRRHGETGEEVRYEASILCKPKRGASDRYLSIFFVGPEAPLPPNEVLPIGGSLTNYYATVYARMDEYLHYVDLLRNERPLTAAVVMGQPSLNRLLCREEEADEAELQVLTGLDPAVHPHPPLEYSSPPGRSDPWNGHGWYGRLSSPGLGYGRLEPGPLATWPFSRCRRRPSAAEGGGRGRIKMRIMRMLWLLAGLLALPASSLALQGGQRDVLKSSDAQIRLVDEDEGHRRDHRYYRDYGRRYYRDYDRPYWGYYRDYGPPPWWRHRYWRDWDRDWD